MECAAFDQPGWRTWFDVHVLIGDWRPCHAAAGVAVAAWRMASSPHSDGDVGCCTPSRCLCFGALAARAIFGTHFPPRAIRNGSTRLREPLSSAFAGSARCANAGGVDRLPSTPPSLLRASQDRARHRRGHARRRIAQIAGTMPILPSRSKATTTEKLGFTGRGEASRRSGSNDPASLYQASGGDTA